jgi:RNA polymerase sigma-B factor
MNTPTQSELDRRVLDNMGLAQSLARAYFRDDPCHDEDLVQVAYIGLVKAARRYRCGCGASFAAFAVPTISGELKRYLRDHGWFVRPPRHIQEARNRLREAEGRLSQCYGRAPSVAELADDLGESESFVREAQCAQSDMRPVSLDAPVAREHETTLGDLIPDSGAAMERADMALLVHAAVRRLPPHERRVLHLRFIEDRTQQDIAAKLGISQMQVSRLLSRSLTTLRDRLGSLEEAAQAAETAATPWSAHSPAVRLPVRSARRARSRSTASPTSAAVTASRAGSGVSANASPRLSPASVSAM